MIELERVSKRFGATLAVDDVSLSIAKGEFCVVIGTSGAGKLGIINKRVRKSAATASLASDATRSRSPTSRLVADNDSATSSARARRASPT